MPRNDANKNSTCKINEYFCVEINTQNEVNSSNAVDSSRFEEELSQAYNAALQEAYIESLQTKISTDMVAGKLPFVVSTSIKEKPMRLEVALTEMTEENIAIIRSYETDGSAITLI